MLCMTKPYYRSTQVIAKVMSYGQVVTTGVLRGTAAVAAPSAEHHTPRAYTNKIKMIKSVLDISSWSHFSYDFTLNKYSKACIPVKLIFSEFCTSVISDMITSRVRCFESI